MAAQYPPNDPQLEEMADRVQSLFDLVVAARIQAERSDDQSDASRRSAQRPFDGPDASRH